MLHHGKARRLLLHYRVLKQSAIADDRKRRTTVATPLEGDLSPGRPAAAFEHAGERKLAGTFTEAFSDKNGEAIKQSYRQRTPLDDRLAQRVERRSQEGRVAGDDNAAIKEQPPVA